MGIITEAEKRQKKKLLLDYLYANLKNHNFWAYRYFFCEFLALLNVLGKFTTRQMILQQVDTIVHTLYPDVRESISIHHANVSRFPA